MLSFTHILIAEFLGTALMILFGVGVHCDEVLVKSKYRGSGHIFAITTWAFGISVVLFIFGGVCINPAMVLCQALLGNIPWANVLPIMIAEMLGGIVGAVIVYIMYKDQFDASVDSVDPVAVRNIFSTNPPCLDMARNFFVEALDTTIFLVGIVAISKATDNILAVGVCVGLLVWAVGMGLGGITGFAMNQARDLGPRIAYQICPIKNKTDNNWKYGLIVPGIAPFVGAAAAAWFVVNFLG